MADGQEEDKPPEPVARVYDFNYDVSAALHLRY